MENEIKKGIGKESQLSKIAAAVNPGSTAEANPTSTQSMITTFVKHFETAALEIVNEMDDDQEELIKKMVDEVTKLQTKNLEEFNKAIGKIVGISNRMIESNNPKLQELGRGMQDQANQELLKANNITLTGENDTFRNRLGREFGLNTEKQPVEKGVKGIGKLAKGFFSEAKTGFKSGIKESFRPEGGFADRIFTTDAKKAERLLTRTEETSKETKTESITEIFKKLIEETLKEGKSQEREKPGKEKFKPIEKLTDLSDSQKKSLEQQGIAPASENDFSYRKDGKPVSIEDINKVLAPKQSSKPTGNSEAQEDAAGISKDAQVEALQKTAESNIIIQENSTESSDTLKKLLEEVKKISEIMVNNGNQSGGGGGGLLDMMPDIDLPGGRKRGRLSRIARSIGRGVRGLGRGVVSGARTVGSAVLRGGSAVMRGAGALLGFGTAAAGAAGAAGATGAGVAGAAGATGAAGKVVSGGSSLASKAGSVLGGAARGAGKVLGGAARVAGKLALPLAAGMALYDGYKGFTADPNATTGQKFKNAGRNVLSGLTFGLVDSTEDKIAKGEYTGTQKPVMGSTEPAKKSSGFFSKNKGMLAGAALGPLGMAAGALYDSTKKTAKTETGKNVDGAIIEAGTAATKDKMKINVPPPTVVNQGGGGGQSAPTITAPGGVGNVRSDDPTWLRFQQRRAVA